MMKTEFKQSDYQRLAARTLVSEAPRQYASKEILLSWKALGLAGEVGELQQAFYSGSSAADNSGILKELGDVFWYVAALYSIAGLEMPEITATYYAQVKTTCLVMLNMSASNVCDLIKKQIFHGHGYTENILADALWELCQVLGHVCYTLNISPTIAMEMNIEKLAQRFPDGFSSEASVEREDVAQRQE